MKFKLLRPLNICDTVSLATLRPLSKSVSMIYVRWVSAVWSVHCLKCKYSFTL